MRDRKKKKKKKKRKPQTNRTSMHCWVWFNATWKGVCSTPVIPRGWLRSVADCHGREEVILFPVPFPIFFFYYLFIRSLDFTGVSVRLKKRVRRRFSPWPSLLLPRPASYDYTLGRNDDCGDTDVNDEYEFYWTLTPPDWISLSAEMSQMGTRDGPAYHARGDDGDVKAITADGIKD